MSIETVEGPRTDYVKGICERDLKSTPILHTKLNELKEEAFEIEVYPSKSDILAIQERIAKQIGPKESEIRAVFAEALHISRRT
jgi:hypothetical protein